MGSDSWCKQYFYSLCNLACVYCRWWMLGCVSIYHHVKSRKKKDVSKWVHWIWDLLPRTLRLYIRCTFCDQAKLSWVTAVAYWHIVAVNLFAASGNTFLQSSFSNASLSMLLTCSTGCVCSLSTKSCCALWCQSQNLCFISDLCRPPSWFQHRLPWCTEMCLWL